MLLLCWQENEIRIYHFRLIVLDPNPQNSSGKLPSDFHRHLIKTHSKFHELEKGWPNHVKNAISGMGSICACTCHIREETSNTAADRTVSRVGHEAGGAEQESEGRAGDQAEEGD